MITRSDTVASPLRQGEEAPASGFGWRKPEATQEPRELQPYTARLTEPELLLPTNDDPTVVDQGLARMSLPPRAAEDRISVTPSRMSLTPSRMSMTPSRILEPTVSLAAPRVPAERVSQPPQDPNAAVPLTGRARGVDYGPWLLVLGTTITAAVIGAVLGYLTRPNVVERPAASTATARVAPRATAAPVATATPAPQATSRAERSDTTTTPVHAEPAPASSVPVMRLGELPVDATAAPEPSAEPAPSAAPVPAPVPARRAPTPRPTPRHR